MRPITFMFLVCSLFLAGCSSSFNSIKPIYPEIANPLFPNTIDNLQPTFRWEPLQESNITYDFILYEGLNSFKYNIDASTGNIGKEVYYRENFAEPQCKLDQPLKAKTEYYWSVRIRRGQSISEWSLYDYVYFTGLGIGQLHNRNFVFRTPNETGN